MCVSKPKVVLVAGASSGIGLACAARLLRDGHRVFGASRSMPTAALPAACAGLERLHVDATDETSVLRAVEAVVDSAGRIDVLLNSVGYALAGPAEQITLDEAQRELDTNFFGYVRTTRAVLPLMRRQRSGLVVNVSSLAGLLGVPFHSMYSASKFAVEGWSEALRMEVAPHGVRVVLVEPGDVRTAFTRNRVRARQEGADGVYAEALRRAVAVVETDEQRGPGPAVVAATVSGIVRCRSPRLRYRTGSRLQRALVGFIPWLPAALVEWGVRRYFEREP